MTIATQAVQQLADAIAQFGVSAILMDSTGVTKAKTNVIIGKKETKETEMVANNQLKITMPTVKKAPVIGDGMTVQKNTYFVAEVQELQVSGTVIAYHLVLQW